MRFDDFLFVVFALVAILAALYLVIPVTFTNGIALLLLVAAVLSAVGAWRKP